MKANLYLVLQGKEVRYGSAPREIVLGSAKVAKNKPSVAANEIAVKVELDIPDALFRRPTLTASIVVPPIGEPVVTADFSEHLSELVREHMGVTLKISEVTED